MKFHDPRIMLFALFAFAAVGSASATPMKTPAPVVATAQAPANPWPSLASVTDRQPGPLLAHDDRDRHDGRWHDHRDDRRHDWRKDQWRREQARREAERRRYWERHHDRAMGHHRGDDHRYYRR